MVRVTRVESFLLTEVVRQKEASGILENATHVRDSIADEVFQLKVNTRGYRDIFRMNSDKLEDGLRYAYDKYGVENTTVLNHGMVGSNDSCHLF